MRKLPVILSSLLLLVGVAGCGASQASGTQGNSSGKPTQQTTFQQAKLDGNVTVGFANEKPYAYANSDGKLTGEAVEVARAVLDKLGIHKMTGVLTQFRSLIPGLNANRFDIITAGMFITPDRAKQIAFANPDYRIGESIAVKKGNPLNLHSYKDIANNSKAKVAVMSGAIEYNYLLKSGVPIARIVIVPDQPSAVSALEAGRADAITMTGPSLESMLKAANDAQLVRAQSFTQPVIDGKSVLGYGAAGFRQSDKDFRDAYNVELKKMEDSGQLLKIIEPFGFSKSELPGNVTALQLSQS